MTRQEQNTHIMSALSTQLQDMPDVQENIGKIFNTWFQGLAEAGLQAMMPMPEAAPQGQPPQQG